MLHLRPSSRRTLRIHAALIALGFVLASLFGTIHEATTTHVRCAAHGELVDVVVAPGPIAHAVGRDAVANDQPATGAFDDEHCGVAAARASRSAPRAPVIAAAGATLGDLVVPVPVAIAPAVTALYRTAPKTSPPV